jgi:hypothetical protein
MVAGCSLDRDQRGKKKKKTHLGFFGYPYWVRWAQTWWARLSVVVVAGLGRLDKKEKKKKTDHFFSGSVSGAAGAHAVHVVGRHRGWSGMVVVAAVAIWAWGGGRWHQTGQGHDV